MGLIKNFLNKLKGNQKALPEGRNENISKDTNDLGLSSNGNSFDTYLKDKAKELSPEQIKEKFIREKIISRLDAQYFGDPIVYNTIYEKLISVYGFDFKDLTLEQFEKYEQFIDIRYSKEEDINLISFKDPVYDDNIHYLLFNKNISNNELTVIIADNDLRYEKNNPFDLNSRSEKFNYYSKITKKFNNNVEMYRRNYNCTYYSDR